MKLLIRIFIWLSIIYHGGLLAFLLVLSWGPIYLAIVKGEKYDWPVLVGNIFVLIIGFIISLTLYRYFAVGRKEIIKRDNMILGLLLVIYFVLIFISSEIIPWVNVVFVVGLGILLIMYSKIAREIT